MLGYIYPLDLVEFIWQGNVSRLKSEDKPFDMLVRRGKGIEPHCYITPLCISGIS